MEAWEREYIRTLAKNNLNCGNPHSNSRGLRAGKEAIQSCDDHILNRMKSQV